MTQGFDRELHQRSFGGRAPGVLYLCGFMSDIGGLKVSVVEALCRERGHAFACFDYRGHGKSPGEIRLCGIDDFLSDALSVADRLPGPLVLVAASMGAWIACLLARQRRERIAGMVTIAAAPDFTEALAAGLDETQRAHLAQRGYCEWQSPYASAPYPLTQRLIDSGQRLRILDRRIAIDGPVRLLHGLNDREVPWQRSALLSKCLDSSDVQLRLRKSGDHRLSTADDLRVLVETVDEVLGLAQNDHLARTP